MAHAEAASSYGGDTESIPISREYTHTHTTHTHGRVVSVDRENERLARVKPGFGTIARGIRFSRVREGFGCANNALQLR